MFLIIRKIYLLLYRTHVNLRDIKDYCSKNCITYLTTLDFLYYAYCRKRMTQQECTEFMQAVNDAGSKLPIIDITQYTCTVQI